MIVKIKLPNWLNSNSFMTAEKVEYKNHRLVDRHLYKVVSRHGFDSFGKETVSTKLAGLIYYPNDVIEFNNK